MSIELDSNSSLLSEYGCKTIHIDYFGSKLKSAAWPRGLKRRSYGDRVITIA